MRRNLHESLGTINIIFGKLDLDTNFQKTQK